MIGESAMDQTKARFEDIMSQKLQWVLDTACGVLRDIHVAEDIAQEVFIRLLDRDGQRKH